MPNELIDLRVRWAMVDISWSLNLKFFCLLIDVCISIVIYNLKMTVESVDFSVVVCAVSIAARHFDKVVLIAK